MAIIPDKDILNGTSTPTVAQFKAEMGKLWDYLNEPEIAERVFVAKGTYLCGASTSFATQTTGGNGSIYSLGPLLLRNTSNTSGNYFQVKIDSAGSYCVYNQLNTGMYLTNGGTSWSSTSDENQKDIVENITDGLNKVCSLRSVIGKYKTDDPEVRRAFLIAQDVQAVLPEAVNENEGVLGLNYTDTIPLLVAAIKELKAEIDVLKGA